MAKLCLKKTSKRVTCSKRYKIEKKVREHNRKQRRMAKKDPFFKGRSKHKKLITVPNMCPFKEDILKEVAAAKQRKEDERLKIREQWKQEKEDAKLAASQSSMEHLKNDAESRQKVHDGLTRGVGGDDILKENVSGSLKTYYREFKKVISAADVVLEVVDARDPLGTRCLEVEQAVLDSPGNKRLIIVINKSDLVSRENLDAWLKYLRHSFPTTAMKASTQRQKNTLGSKKFKPNKDVSGSNCVGANLLMSLLANYCRNKGIKTAITVGVVGMPNVGKSSIINSLRRSRVCNVGALPGITRSMQVVTLDSKIKLLDSPGVVLSKSSDALAALKNVLNVDSIKDPVKPALAILQRASKEQLMKLYEIEDFKTPEEFLVFVAKRYGKQKKRGIPDSISAARLLINDWNHGKIKYHTVPPEDSIDTHVSAEIVRQMAEEFDLDSFKETEEVEMKALEATQVDLDSSLLLETVATMELETPATDDILADNVSVTGGERAKKPRWRKGEKKEEKPDQEMTIEGNLKQNKFKKVEFKKLKKAQAKNVRKTDQLADVLENFSFGTETASTSAEGMEDDYDFNSAFGI